MKIDKTHEFGGDWTAIKLDALSSYLQSFSTALSKQSWCKRVYIDAFSGTGQCDITAKNGEVQQIDGSAKIALETTPNFHELHFVDIKKKHVNALKELCANHSNQNCQIYHDDSNNVIPSILNNLSNSHRGVLFIDPYGMHFNWETLKKVATSEKFDVWYLFPLSGLFRNAALSEADIEENKDKAITRLLGEANWKDNVYKKSPIQDMFDDMPKERVEWKELSTYATTRLQTIFPLVLGPRIIFTKNKIPKFALYFAVGNKNKTAQGLAKKIASHILATMG